MMPLAECQERVTIYPFVLTQYGHWTDRQTDRQTDMVEQYRALHDARRKVNSLREVSC